MQQCKAVTYSWSRTELKGGLQYCNHCISIILNSTSDCHSISVEWRSLQAIYVPADDLTDPAPATTFAHLDATTVLSRSIAELGIYPAVDPLDSTSRMLDARIIGEEHYGVARDVQQVLQVRSDSRRYPSMIHTSPVCSHCHSSWHKRGTFEFVS